MVTPIHVIPSGMGFDQAGRWHEAKATFRPARHRQGDEDPISPARGAMYGLLISGGIWLGIIATVKTISGLL